MKNKNILILLLAVIVILLLFVLLPRWGGMGHMGSWGYGRDSMYEEMEDHHYSDEKGLTSNEIYPGIVAKKIEHDEAIILIDVRSSDEYTQAHVKDAVLLPLEELSQQTLTAVGVGVQKKDSEIIIYSRSGSESEQAQRILQSLGYTNVKSVSGGMVHWQEDDYPFIETGAYENTNTTETMTEAASVPKVTLNKTLHDFGEIPQYSGTVEATFEVANEGSEILSIGDITTSCSCTSASISESEIKAGETALLTVVFDPDFHEEPLDTFRRTVFIPTNDPQKGEVEVAIQVDIMEGV